MRQIQGLIAWQRNAGTLDMLPATSAPSVASLNAGTVFPVRVALRDVPGGSTIDWADFPTIATGAAACASTGDGQLEAVRFTVQMTNSVIDAETVSVAGLTFEFNATGTVAGGNVTVDVTGGTTSANAISALLSKINALGLPSLKAASISSTKLEINTTTPTHISETLTNGTASVAPRMFNGVAEFQVRPTGFWTAADTYTVTAASLVAPDGRTVTATSTSVATAT